MSNKYQPTPCPKCGRNLPPAGEFSVDGHSCPVYTCDECIVIRDVFGVEMELPLTFGLDPQGRAVDPAAADGVLKL